MRLFCDLRRFNTLHYKTMACDLKTPVWAKYTVVTYILHCSSIFTQHKTAARKGQKNNSLVDCVVNDMEETLIITYTERSSFSL